MFNLVVSYNYFISLLVLCKASKVSGNQIANLLPRFKAGKEFKKGIVGC